MSPPANPIIRANDDCFARPLRRFGSALGGKYAGILERAPRIGRTVKPRAAGPCKVCGERRWWCEHELTGDDE